MAESRYGRLFTEADVKALLRCGGWVADDEPDPDLASALEVADSVRPLTFPADEPLFLLRGQDSVAPKAITAYAHYCVNAGALVEHVAAVVRACDDVHRWQNANPDRVKVPD